MNEFHVIIACVFVLLLTGFISYQFGKHMGRRIGEQMTRATIPIELRNISMEQGRCPICDHYNC